MKAHRNANEKWCTPQLRCVFESFSTQLSIGELEQLRNEVPRNETSANLALSGARVFDELLKSGRIDETNQAQLAEFCRSAGRYDLLMIIGGRRAVPVVDPVEEFIKDRQIAENKHAKKYTLKKLDELTSVDCSGPAEYAGPLTRSRKRLYEQQLTKPSAVASGNANSDGDAEAGETDAAPKQIRLDRIAESELSSGASCSGLASATASTSVTRRTLSPLSSSISNTHRPAPSSSNLSSTNSASNSGTLIRKKVTCDVNLRVRAEYQDHEAALSAAVGSTRETETERQFERFAQANQVLRSRDLGAIVCEIKFSELTYLDAFWRDYINGSLLHALRDVFITESLRQAVNYEQVRLLITVDEDDYETGRTTLVHNL